jgi:hypothetical protein
VAILMWAVPVTFLIMGYALLDEGDMALVAIGVGLVLASRPSSHWGLCISTRRTVPLMSRVTRRRALLSGRKSLTACCA